MKNIIKLILIFIFLIIPSVYATMLPSQIDSSEVKEKIDNIYNTNKDSISGFSVMVFTNDDIIFDGYYGYTNKEKNIKVDENSVFEWGSISKLLVWTSIMQLKEKGLVDLNTDIREYLPDGFLKLKYDEKITLLNLMNHNAGFDEMVIGMYENNPSNVKDLEYVLKKYQPRQVYQPGKVVSYSNYGCALAGYIVERISGEKFYDYVKKNILNKLDMNNTSIKPDYSDNKSVYERRMNNSSYSTTGEPISEKNVNAYINIYPAGSTVGTIDDLRKFISEFLIDENTQSKLFNDNKILKEMLEVSNYVGNSKIIQNSHGIWNYYYDSGLIYGHNGGTNGYLSNSLFSVDNKIGYIIFNNQIEETAISNTDELVFGKRNYSELNKKNNYDLSGYYLISRSVMTGPISSIYKYYVKASDYVDNLYMEVGEYNGRKIIYTNGSADLIEISLFELIVHYALIINILFAFIYSIISSISLIIKKIKKKEISKIDRYNYLLNGSVILFIIPYIILYYLISNYYNCDYYIWLFYLSYIIIPVIIILLVLFLNSMRKNKFSIKHILTIIIIILLLFAYFYNGMYIVI